MHATQLLLSFVAAVALPLAVNARQRCVWVVGKVQCKANPAEVMDVEIRVVDRDGPPNDSPFAFLDGLDRDDLMGVGYPDAEGNFRVDGCASDFDWFFISNDPDPYITMFHKCGRSDRKEVRKCTSTHVHSLQFKLMEFRTFVPETFNVTQSVGVVVLDDHQ